jgi:NADH:ubiquinone oxidoreductase subunit
MFNWLIRILKPVFTWWDDATIGTRLFTRRHGRRVGADEFGNVYYQAKKGNRRWVIYKGSSDTSRIPPDWYSWILGQTEGLPDQSLPAPQSFQKPHTPNLSGTAMAYRPAGSMDRGGHRAAASGDYQAWTPD